MTDAKAEYEKLRDTYYFNDLYHFIKESTGVAITLSYLLLILSSFIYLSVFYDHFDIKIIKLVSLEDILVTPIKNPYIILAVTTILIAVYLVDIGNRYNARLNLQYYGRKTPWRIKLIKLVVWSPKTKKGNIRLTIAMVLGFLGLYVYIFANSEAETIQEGKGYKVMLTLSDSDVSSKVTLLGATTHYVMVYDSDTKQSKVYQVESVASLTPTGDTQ